MMTHNYTPNKEGKLSRKGVPYPEYWEQCSKSEKRAFYKMQSEWTCKAKTPEELKDDYIGVIIFGICALAILGISHYMFINGIKY